MENLVIVESPTKARTLSRFLGPDFRIEASFGHIRDLPEKNLGVDLERDFKPKYVLIKGKRKRASELKKIAQKAQKLYLATDPDREGEAIAWHVLQVLGKTKNEVSRIVFHEITKQAIEEAFKNPRGLDFNLIDAQQARRILDRLVGYKLSPLLWQKVQRGLSAGRVQSVTVRLVVEREREIEDFIREEYWQILAGLNKNNSEPFLAKLVAKSGEKYESCRVTNLFCGKHRARKTSIENKEQAEGIIKDLTSPFVVDKVEKKEALRNPPPPFTTSTLQQKAFGKFGWSGKMTMRVAQSLYERGLCVDENSLVVTKEGEIYKIKELGNLKKTLVGIDEKTLKAKFAEINKFWKIKAPSKIINIETSDHERLSITPDHPLMIIRNGHPTWVKGESVQKGDYIAALETIPVRRRKTPSSLIEVIKHFPKSIRERVVFTFSPQFSSLIRRKKKRRAVPYHVIERLWREKRMRMGKIEKHYRGIKVKPTVGDSKFHKIPFYFNPKIAYLVGLVAADGHLDRKRPKINLAIKSKSKLALNELDKLLEEILGIKFSRFILGRNQVPVNSTFLYYLIQQLGIPAGNKATRIDISNILLSQPEGILKAYIAGLWDGDGCITKSWKNRIRLSYSSRSEIFIDKLRLLLKTFGMNSAKHLDKRNKVYWLLLTTNAISGFRDNIVPYLIIKKEKWNNLHKRYRQLYEGKVISRGQKVPGINLVLESFLIKSGFPKQRLSKLIGVDLFNYFGEIGKGHNRVPFIPKSVLKNISKFLDRKDKLFNKLSETPIIWKEITNVKRVPCRKPYVYDVTTSTNTFIANGIVSHNCTYHRTDSTKLSSSAVSAIREYVKKNFEKDYLPPTPRIYKTKSKVAQEAHEAIRPTNVELKVEVARNEKKLYDLIWQRAVASQMSPAKLEETNISISCGDYQFESRGQRMVFDGFMKVYPIKFSQNLLPAVQEGEKLNLVSLGAIRNLTSPPSRYNEASLIKTLEREGIGRPSTYAPIISTVQERQYIEKIEGKFRPTELGLVVNDFLVEHFGEIVDIPFTAKMEDDLDKIANGAKNWVPVVGEFYRPFSEKLAEVTEIAKKVKVEEELREVCPKCGAFLVVKFGKYGKFVSCSKFPTCDFKKSFVEKIGQLCPECEGEIIVRKTKRGKIFYGCSNYPKCNWASWEKPKTDPRSPRGVEPASN